MITDSLLSGQLTNNKINTSGPQQDPFYFELTFKPNLFALYFLKKLLIIIYKFCYCLKDWDLEHLALLNIPIDLS